MLVCRAPTYPPKTGPTKKKKKMIAFLRNVVNKYFFKIIKSCVLIEERLQRMLLYAFLPFAFVDL